MNTQNEFSSFKLLLKQVYSAHTTKVKELENENKSLKEKLIEKERLSNTTVTDCKRCIELEDAFKSCKKALHEQSKMFENFGQKFSIFNSSQLGSQDFKKSGISNYGTETDKTSNLKSNVEKCDKNESSLLSLGDTLTESKLNDAEKLPLVSNNQNLLKNFMHINENFESFDVLTVTFPENAKHNVKSDSLILAPDSLDVNLDTFKAKPSSLLIHKKVSNGDESEISRDLKKNLSSKTSGKRSSIDSLNEDRIKRCNTGNQIENYSKINRTEDANNQIESISKDSKTKAFNSQIESCSKISTPKHADDALENCFQTSRIKDTKVSDVVPEIIVTNDAADVAKNITLKSKMSLKDLNKQNVQVSKKKQILTDGPKDEKLLMAKNSMNHLANDLKMKASEISPSLLSSARQLPKVIDIESISNDNDDFQENTSNCKFVSMEDSWEICDKKKNIRKNKSIKSIKTTSKYKMTLDAPPLNGKKPNYKQTKLSKSLFKVKDLNKNSNEKSISNCDVDIVISEEDDSSTAQPEHFYTSTQCPNKSVDIDATFIPENFRLESPDFVTSNVKKNTVAKSNLKNGGLFSNISFTQELKPAANDDEGNEYENDDSLCKDAEVKENMNSFDRIPVPEEPNYKYKNEVVRKKAERRQLNAFDCNECEKYYSELGLSDKEKKERMKKCSRHRAKFTPPSTPDHFWELDFPDTQECKARGYLNATQKVKLNNICNL